MRRLDFEEGKAGQQEQCIHRTQQHCTAAVWGVQEANTMSMDFIKGAGAVHFCKPCMVHSRSVGAGWHVESG